MQAPQADNNADRYRPVLDVESESPATGVPPLVTRSATELFDGRWTRLNEQGISRAVRRPFAVVVRGTAFAQGLARIAPGRHAYALGSLRSLRANLAWGAELARWSQQGGQLRPEQGHGGEEKQRSLTLARASAKAIAIGAIGQQLPEAPGE